MGNLRRKVRLRRRGFVGPVLATVGGSIGQRLGAWRPREPRFPSPLRASQPAPAPMAAQGASPAPERAQARDGALLQSLAFELAQGRENCELEPAAGGAKYPDFLQRNEWDVQGLEILQHRHEMFQITPDSIQRPAHSDLDIRTTSIEKKPIKTRPAILRPAHLVGVFRIDIPAPRLAVSTELEELVFARLRTVGGADAGVDSGLHGNTAFTFEVIRSPSQSMP